LKQADDDLVAWPGPGNASAIEFSIWLRQPAVLRGIAAHSNGVYSQLRQVTNPIELEIASGGYNFTTGSHVWRWVGSWVGNDWVLAPSFAGESAGVDFFVYRTLWESKVLDGAGQSFFLHDGCEVVRPLNAEAVPYDDPNYGGWPSSGAVQNGESLMFYANGLGLMARNKVFNDTPAGFAQAIKATGGRFSAGWAAYFDADAANAGLNERAVDPTVVQPGSDRRWRTLQRKRSYFWSLIGDPALRIRY
jgi:hypothetical protein